MVARLKLKGIDGRAPPGVNFQQLAAVALLRTAARKGEVVWSFKNASPLELAATPSNCGKLLKLGHQPCQRKLRGGQVNSLGYGNSSEDDTMDDPQPSPLLFCALLIELGKVQRLDGGGLRYPR